MTAILDNNTSSNENSKNKSNKGFANKLKEFKKNHTVLFWLIIAAIVILLIGIIVVVVVIVTTNKKKKDEESKEGYSASNSISNEFDYVNSVIYSALGDLSGLQNINAGSVPVA